MSEKAKERTLYFVSINGSDGEIIMRRLVRADSSAKALRHVANCYKATPNTIATLMQQGTKIEEAE